MRPDRLECNDTIFFWSSRHSCGSWSVIRTLERQLASRILCFQCHALHFQHRTGGATMSRMDRSDVPVEAEMCTVECFCDHCGKSLNKFNKIWVWNEHFGCSRDHVQRAQGNANALASAAAFKRSVEERDIDLL